MRWTLGIVIGLALAALPPAVAAQAPPDLAAKVDAQQFAVTLMGVLTEVSQNYVRPVGRDELAAAALAGLYETARKPMPPGLRADLEAAEKRDELSVALARARLDVGGTADLQGARGLVAACRGMLKALDPYCALVSGGELRRSSILEQNFGVGVELADGAGAGPVVLKAVVPGGPAQRAGLRPGDEITAVDGRDLRGLAKEQIQLLLNSGSAALGMPNVDDAGEPAAAPTARLALRRGGAGDPVEVTVERQTFHPETVLGVARRPDNTWDYWLDRKRRIAYVRLANLGHETASELQGVLANLGAGSSLGGLILDLRWSPGGFLSEAVGVARLFLGDGVVATVKSRQEQDVVYRTGEGTGQRYPDVPLVVLVNGDTSGGAELIAAAVQDHKRAAVVGQRTRGKGSVQTVTYLPVSGMGLKLTSGIFLRPNGQNLHRFPESTPAETWGVRPDPGRERRVSPDLAKQLQGWWQDQTLRPGSSVKPLPLDWPAVDPQQQAALKVLLEKMQARKSS